MATETTPPEGDDIEAAINAALDRMESGGTEGEPAGDAAGETNEAEAGQPRDAQGRFASNDPAREPEGPGSGASPDPAPAVLEFPEHWSENRRQRVLSLPAEHQAAIFGEWRDIEREISDRQRELAAQRQAVEPLLGVLEPLRPTLAAQGIAPEAALQSFLAGMQRLRNDPQQGLFELAEQVGRPLAGSASAQELIRRLSQTLGVDLGASPDQAASAEYEWLDPRAAREVTALRGQLSEMQTQLAQFTQHQQQAAMSQAQREAQAFETATGTDGQPAHPHFSAVKQQMAQLIGAGVAADLEQAYQMAVWSNAQVRQQMLEAQRTAENAKREAERKAAVAKAKQASAPPSGRSKPMGRPEDDQSFEDALGAAVDRVLASQAA